MFNPYDSSTYSQYNPEQQDPFSRGGYLDAPAVYGGNAMPYYGGGDAYPTGGGGGYGPDPYMPDTPTGGGGGNGGGIMDWINQLFPGMNGSSGFGGLNGNMIPFIASAMNDYNNSGKYMDLATKYADKMDPFGSQRGYYQDRLKSLTNDPNGYLKNSPDYQAALEQGLGAVDRTNASKGYFGGGKMSSDEQRFGSGLAAQYLDKDRQSLMQMAGSQIGPAAAAALISQGIQGSVASQNNALSNLTAAFTKPAQSNVDPRTGQPYPKSGGGSPNGPGNGGGGGGGGYNPNLPGGHLPGPGSDVQIDPTTGDVYRQMPDGSWKYMGQGNQGGYPGEDPSYDPYNRGGYTPGEPGYDPGGSTPYDPYGTGNYDPSYGTGDPYNTGPFDTSNYSPDDYSWLFEGLS